MIDTKAKNSEVIKSFNDLHSIELLL